MKEPHLYIFKNIADSRGNLSFLDKANDMPFEVKRAYWITEIPEQQARGGHAHRTGEQVIVCIQGTVEVVLESQKGEVRNYTLDQPNQGLYIPPMWWGKMLFRGKALMLGLASDNFSEADYIRNKSEF